MPAYSRGQLLIGGGSLEAGPATIVSQLCHDSPSAHCPVISLACLPQFLTNNKWSQERDNLTGLDTLRWP
ncbi:hypothetical protein XELAEV_18004609mg [Xenopus laevis]|uniref:Uncharacterized protein n=1 Tax=Xenopus laevis TaxID=8355 RepID=A0A974BR56_XENLA|nr:hypothetical protein XELAEV_18004609mg [Xenopus laevis]